MVIQVLPRFAMDALFAIVTMLAALVAVDLAAIPWGGGDCNRTFPDEDAA